MFGQFSGAAPPSAVPEGAVVDEDPSVVELEPESPGVALEDESEERLVCACATMDPPPVNAVVSPTASALVLLHFCMCIPSFECVGVCLTKHGAD
jgi:hypothetical protein